ncbi:MAG: hypothetical protein Q9220_001150 [cf. Caloplaca sp. 1 TL-2023]
MPSGFVSGGTTETPIERDDEWLKAQQEIEANRRRKEEESRQADGKTLYEVLQNNKAAKQEAFEESIRLKNQFRNLDEDEVEFLDSVLESTRAKEAAVKKETTEQLSLFRQQQEQADREHLNGTDTADDKEEGATPDPSAKDAQWATNARKRKRTKDKEGLPGLKLRKSSTNEGSPTGPPSETVQSPNQTTTRQTETASPASPSSFPRAGSLTTSTPSSSSPEKAKAVTLGLAGYSSDEEG